ncbi:MAG: ATP synthase F1 subunit delta [Candidatus Binatia bacterium]
MLQSPAARRYAKALLDLATVQQAEEIIGTELSQIVQALTAPDIARVMALPTLPGTTRKNNVEDLVSSLQLHPHLSNYHRVLADNDRLTTLTDIYNAYQRLLEQATGKVRAYIRSAVPLSDEELTTIVEAFGRLTQRTVLPTVEVDPQLLGGVVVEIEGRVYDASLQAQLRRMGEALVQQL